MMRYKLGKINTSMAELAIELNLQSLADRRFNNDIFFLYTLLNNQINCPEHLKKSHLMSHSILSALQIPFMYNQKKNYSHYAPMNRIY